ncbi:sodium-dependent proline transporter-like isoform X2 [Haemaphysalis longicornis]
MKLRLRTARISSVSPTLQLGAASDVDASAAAPHPRRYVRRAAMSNEGSGGSETGDPGLLGPPGKEAYAQHRAIIYISFCVVMSYQCLTEFPYLLIAHGGGIGMAMLLKTFVICAYKAFENACLFFYFLQSFQQELPWTHCYTWWGATDINCRERKPDDARACQAAKERVYNQTLSANYNAGRNFTTFSFCGKTVKASTQDVANLTGCLDHRKYTEYSFFLNGMLKLSASIDDFGGLRWELLVCYIFTWFFIFVCTAPGVASVGRISRVVGIVPSCLLVAVAVKAMFLADAKSSVLELLSPSWSCLIDAKAWSDASFYVLTGLAIGVGQLHSLASYNDFESPSLFWCHILMPIGMTMFNIVCSVIVFGIGGSLAKQLGVCFSDFETYTFVFPYVIFAEVVKKMDWPRFWSGIFYGSVFLLSVDETIFHVCTVVACAEDLFPDLRSNINRTVFFVCAGMFVSGFPTVTQAGAYIMRLLEDHAVKQIMAHFVPLVEICLVMWVYSLKRFCFDLEFMLGRPPNVYFQVCWVALCPVFMAIAYVKRMLSYSAPVYNGVQYPGEYEALAWIIGCTGLLQVPIGAIACIVDNIRFPARAFQPEFHWEPNADDNRVLAYFEELEEQGGDSGAEIQGALYEGTEALEVSLSIDEPLVFKPTMDTV